MPTWQLDTDAHLIRRMFDDGTVLYHRESGDTHLLSNVSLAIVDALKAAPRSEHDLVALAAGLAAPNQAETLGMQIEELLAKLQRSGIVCKADE